MPKASKKTASKRKAAPAAKPDDRVRVRKTICPTCWIERKEQVPLQYRPGSNMFHHCQHGHEFKDRDKLAELVNKTQVWESEQQYSKRMEQEERAARGEPEPEEEVEPKGPIEIDEVNQARLESLLGSFTDASTLFGAVFNLNQELVQARERAAQSESARSSGKVRTSSNGDLVFEAVIPEEHVQPLKDLVKNNATDIETYMNDRIAFGFANWWYYVLVMAIGAISQPWAGQILA